MIELTPEQRQAMDQGEPVRVIDAMTREAYVVLRPEVYERLAGVIHPPAEEAPTEIAPGILRSMQAYWRDLPELLKKKRDRGKWVAYHGDERIGIAVDDVTLIRELLRKGLPDDAYYLATVRPRELPPWEPEEVEPLGPQDLEDY